jgi:hypothetical protein
MVLLMYSTETREHDMTSTFTLHTLDTRGAIVGDAVTSHDLNELREYTQYLEGRGKQSVIVDEEGRSIYTTFSAGRLYQHRAIAHMLGTRDVSAEQRPKYKARLIELVSQLAASIRTGTANPIYLLTDKQADALIQTLRTLPYTNGNTAIGR